jgi:hypothetical protein
LGLPFFREPSGWEVIFLQGEFSSILTNCKCPSHMLETSRRKIKHLILKVVCTDGMEDRTTNRWQTLGQEVLPSLKLLRAQRPVQKQLFQFTITSEI